LYTKLYANEAGKEGFGEAREAFLRVLKDKFLSK
jgi:hypothetical protein